MSTADTSQIMPLITLPSPCVGICKIDEATKLCVGCARTEAEIAAWKETPDPERQRVWDALPARRQALGIELFKLLWRPPDFLDFIEATLRRQAGEWTIGIQGASASFVIGQTADTAIKRDETSLTVRTEHFAWRFVTHEKAAAFGLGEEAGTNGPQAIGIALPRSRITIKGSSHFCRAGQDADVIVSQERNVQLYDIGLGDKAMRFCVCPMSAEHVEICEALIGSTPDIALPRLSQMTTGNGLHYIIETGLGRFKAFALHGCADRLLPKLIFNAELLMSGREPPPDWDLHPAFAPCAVFRAYPGHSISAIVDSLF